MSHRSFLVSTCLVALLAACGSPPLPAADPDAGTAESPDAYAGPPLSCATTTRLEGVIGAPMRVSFDTAMTMTRPRDLGLACGNSEPALRWAPQEIVELHVPGTGPIAIELDSAIEGTDPRFNTVLQVRRECESVPTQTFPPTCFDDQYDDVAADEPEFRGRGAITANGGEVLYLVVTGYSEPPADQETVDRGPIAVDITFRENAAPTLTSGYVRLAGDDVLIRARGGDADGDAVGVAMNFRGPDGALLDIYGDGEATLDGDVYFIAFDPPTSAVELDAAARAAAATGLGTYLRAVGATEAILTVYDRAWRGSDSLEVPIEEAMLVGYMEPCGDESICRAPMACIAAVCDVEGEARTICESARAIVIDTPGATATTASIVGTTGAGPGQYAATCPEGEPDATAGAETAYSVTVPEGAYDLIATTARPGTGETDTVISVRSACPDIGSEVACSDDIDRAGMVYQSAIEVRDVRPGTYSVLVETYGGLATGRAPHELEVTLRPVRAAGATCDMTGVASRCASGTCTAGVCP
jgi:hypothetical protein